MVIEALATNLPAVGAGNDAIEPPIVMTNGAVAPQLFGHLATSWSTILLIGGTPRRSSTNGKLL
jgi:hypothetical protein